MTQTAQALGFTYSRKGCPCNGTPLIYTKQTNGVLYTLTLWERRNTWRLTARGCVVATGNKENMEERINNILNM